MHKMLTSNRTALSSGIQKVRVEVNRIAAEKKRTAMEFFGSHIRRLITEVFNIFFDHDWIFWLIGMINKKIRIIESIFLVYPANDDYDEAYAYSWRSRWHYWKPGLIGIFWQSGKIGVKFAISAHNGDFKNPQNQEKLKEVAARMEKLRKLFGADRKTFAGILPGVLLAKRILRENYETEITVRAILQAMEQVIEVQRLPKTVPIIVLGARGFFGRRVVKALHGKIVYSVDISGNGDSAFSWPAHLRGERVILLNIAAYSALDEYITHFWPGIVVVNEVYPEPSEETENRLKEAGCPCYHIVGVKGGAFPSFPHGYYGGIPCCAAWPSKDLEALVLEVD